jgi:hypothetical protein
MKKEGTETCYLSGTATKWSCPEEIKKDLAILHFIKVILQQAPQVMKIK